MLQKSVLNNRHTYIHVRVLFNGVSLVNYIKENITDMEANILLQNWHFVVYKNILTNSLVKTQVRWDVTLCHR
jgi:hypothetical protein